MTQQQLDGYTARTERWVHNEQRNKSHLGRSIPVQTLWITRVTAHLERHSLFPVLVQSSQEVIPSPSQLARRSVWSELLGYSVGVVATGLRMGVGKSLNGHMGEMALWL